MHRKTIGLRFNFCFDLNNYKRLHMKIKFQAPPKTSNLIDFDPGNKDHYPDPSEYGVYIYGIRLWVNSVLKFVPIVVGEGSLLSRLFTDHYHKKFSNPINSITGHSKKKSGDPKELWDFSKLHVTDKDLAGLYSDIMKYNSKLAKNSSKTLMASGLVHLLYFQDVNFYNKRFGITLNSETVNLKVENAVEYLFDISSSQGLKKPQSARATAARIILTLHNLKEHFYYVYAGSSDHPELINKRTRLSIEFNVKERLKSINIYTSAKANGIIDNTLQFDFSAIQDDLICIGNHNYLNPAGGYKSSLIL